MLLRLICTNNSDEKCKYRTDDEECFIKPVHNTFLTQAEHQAMETRKNGSRHAREDGDYLCY